MFKNYFIVALRNFWRNKIFSLINIIGLAIGISASLVIYLIVSYDFSFDKFEKDRDRIFRIVTDMKFPDNDFKNSGVPLPLIPAAQKELTGIELFVPLSAPNGNLNVSIDQPSAKKPDVYKKQKSIAYTDGNYFKMIPYKWLAGSQQTALSEPFSTVLTLSRAKIYFPYDDVTKIIGKTIAYNDSIKTTVTGVVQDFDERSDLTFKEFISYSTIANSGLGGNLGIAQWGSVSSADQFYIKLSKGTDTSSVRKQIQQLFDKNQNSAYLKDVLTLQPLSDIHFNNDYDAFDNLIASMSTLNGLLAVAAILLLLGCINFINLTTAQAVKRAKEIGIRKTMGSSKRQLIFQFLSETFLLTIIATILSILLVPLILNLFSDFISPNIHAGMLANTNVIVFIIVLVIGVSVLSGFYPAMILSKYNPVLVLKNQLGTTSPSTRKAWLRKSLTVTQFVFAQAFVIATLIVGQQIQYALHKDLGFKKDGIITVQTPLDFYHSENLKSQANTREVLLRQILSLPGVANACIASDPPATSGGSMTTMKFNNGKKEIETTVQVKYGDESYFKLYNMQLVAGRFPRKTDSLTEYVINENYARFLGFKNPADAVGKFIEKGDKNGVPIVGVMRDFYARSMHEPIKPMAIYSNAIYESTLHIALKPETSRGEWKTTIAQIEEAYKHIYPQEDFSYNFVDDTIAKFYDTEQRTSTLLSWTAALAIIISCLGLLGLVIYTTNQRTKEIGVRKVLGASVLQIVNLISKDFLKLVVVAFMIAAPIAWWGMNVWLQNFVYHIQISIGLFVTAGALMILIAIITLSFQTIKAASANPVKSLRTE
jgi:putative ABC transport system permease protein